MSVELRLRGVLERPRRPAGGRRVDGPMRRSPDGERNVGRARLGRTLIGLALVGLGSILLGCTGPGGPARQTPNFPIEVFEGTCPAAACVATASPRPTTAAPTQP